MGKGRSFGPVVYVNVRRFLDLKGDKGIFEVANLARVSPDTVSNLIRRGRASYEVVRRIAQAFGVPVEELVLDQPAVISQFVYVPRFGAVGGLDVTVELYAFRKSWIERFGDPDAMVLVFVTDDGMEPLVKKRDIVLINTAEVEPKSGCIYAVRDHGSILIRKVFWLGDDQVLLVGCDANVSPPLYRRLSDLEIIGRVIWLGRELV